MDFEDDSAGQADTSAAPATNEAEGSGQTPAQRAALVKQILQTIKADKKHHEKAFKRMRRDMQVAMWGAEKDWGEDKYRANIAGRHVKQKTAALYAKNPKATAGRRETLDYAVWDENPQSLMLAYQTIQAGAKAGVPVSVCGEMAGDPSCARLLIGMGLRHFSMHPAQILAVKQEVLRADATRLSGWAQRVLAAEDPSREMVLPA